MDLNKTLKQLEETLEVYFLKKAPAMPEDIKNIIVAIAPYLIILSLFFSIPAILLLFGLNTIFTALAPFAGARGIASVPTLWVGSLLLVLQVILDILAIPGLFTRSKTGWKYIYWGMLISLAVNIVSFNLIGAIIGGLIGFYILFQVKSHYK